MSRSGSQPSAAEPADRSADASGELRASECHLVQAWIDAFNARSLEAMLDCMSPAVTFQPLRLHGIERTYNGHDGIVRWHDRLVRLQPVYRITVEQLSVPVEVTVLVTGRLTLEGLDDGAPFWGVHTIEDGQILTARHYLGDADLAERFAVR